MDAPRSIRYGKAAFLISVSPSSGRHSNLEENVISSFARVSFTGTCASFGSGNL